MDNVASRLRTCHHQPAGTQTTSPANCSHSWISSPLLLRRLRTSGSSRSGSPPTSSISDPGAQKTQRRRPRMRGHQASCGIGALCKPLPASGPTSITSSGTTTPRLSNRRSPIKSGDRNEGGPSREDPPSTIDSPTESVAVEAFERLSAGHWAAALERRSGSESVRGVAWPGSSDLTRPTSTAGAALTIFTMPWRKVRRTSSGR